MHCSAHLERSGKPIVEGVAAVEDMGQDEVEERPELTERVLNGRARQQHAVLHQEAAQNLCQLAARILQPMALIHYQQLPMVLQRQQHFQSNGCILPDVSKNDLCISIRSMRGFTRML